jgi:hypothetical protein
MAAFTSKATGTWHVAGATTWNEAGYPGSTGAQTDTATIQNGHVITISTTTEAGQIGAVTVQSGGELIINCVRGQSFNGILTINLGGIVTFQYNTDTKLLMENNVSNSGTLNMGTVANPISLGNTCTLSFNCASDGQYGLSNNNGSVWNAQGQFKTKYITLAANASVNATSLTISGVPTNWKDNDEIAIASTTKTYSQKEIGTLSADVASTTMAVDGFGGVAGGVAYAHDGTGLVVAEIVNLTRNCRVIAENHANVSYIDCFNTSVSDCDNVEFKNLGVNSSYPGIAIRTTVGSANFNGCSINTPGFAGVYLVSSPCNNLTVDGCVGYSVGTSQLIYISATSQININISNNVMIGGTNSYFIGDVGITFSNNIATSASSAGVQISESNGEYIGDINNIKSHSNNSYGVYFAGNFYFGVNTVNDIDTLEIRRNNSNGLIVQMTGDKIHYIQNVTMSGNDNSNLYTLLSSGLLMDNFTLDSEASYSTTQEWFAPITWNCRMYNSALGATTPTGALIFTGNTSSCDIMLYNTTANPADVAFYGSDDMVEGRTVSAQNRNNVEGVYKIWKRYGKIETETTMYHNASPAIRMTPNSATVKINWYWEAIAKDLQTVTVKVWLYKSKSTDFGGAANYNGNEPRLKMKGAGISEQTATMTAAIGNWEELTVSGAATENGGIDVWIDCDGTTGYIYIDDFSISYS